MSFAIPLALAGPVMPAYSNGNIEISAEYEDFGIKSGHDNRLCHVAAKCCLR